MMSQLSGRIDSMKSGGKQPKEVRYADRIEMFPWRPRYDIDTTENIVINAGAPLYSCPPPTRDVTTPLGAA
eukprot:7462028-Ditylum_brightwellii.AAC.1